MASKPGAHGESGVHNNRGGGVPGLPIVLVIFLTVLSHFIFFAGRGLIYASASTGQVTSQIGSSKLDLDWRKGLAYNSSLEGEVIDNITARTVDMGPFSSNSSSKNNLPASWRDITAETSVENIATSEQPRDLRHRKDDTDLVQQEDAAISKLEDAAIERSKSVDAAIFGRYSIWRKENENKKSDSTARLMRDQIIMARVYTSIAKMKNKLDLHQEIESRLKESQRAVGNAMSDSDLHHRAPEIIKAMGKVLSKAREQLYDCKSFTRKLRAMIQIADEQVQSLDKQWNFLTHLAGKTVTDGIHCLSLRLSIEYYLLPFEKRIFPRSEKLGDPNLYHYALFSDNVVAASVVVNSTIMNAKDSSKHVFHIVSNKFNFGAISMWFLLNPPGNATVHVENVDEFKWLNSSYCPVLQQLETATLKEYYFQNHASSLPSDTSDLKYRNPKYISMLNHLRFYLPEVYPKLDKILFLDEDVVVQKDLTKLWSLNLHGKVNGAVETCGKTFHRFNTYLNFSDPHITRHFDPHACGWAFGMNIFDLKEWRKKDITGIYHKWQKMNEDRVLWKLGSLPPGLMAFYNLTQPMDKSWHVLGLGYNSNLDMSEIEKAAVIHYNGNMKPWLELAYTRYRSFWAKYINYDHPYLRRCNIKHRRIS